MTMHDAASHEISVVKQSYATATIKQSNEMAAVTLSYEKELVSVKTLLALAEVS